MRPYRHGSLIVGDPSLLPHNLRPELESCEGAGGCWTASEFRRDFYRSVQGRRTLFRGEFKVGFDERESRLPDEARFLDGRTPLFDYDPRMHLDQWWDHF